MVKFPGGEISGGEISGGEFPVVKYPLVNTAAPLVQVQGSAVRTGRLSWHQMMSKASFKQIVLKHVFYLFVVSFNLKWL